VREKILISRIFSLFSFFALHSTRVQVLCKKLLLRSGGFFFRFAACLRMAQQLQACRILGFGL
jgi:hypothetical protein